MYNVHMLTKKLTRSGNSAAIVLDKTLLGLLNIDPDGEVDLSIEGDRLVVTAHRKADRSKARAAARAAMVANRATFEKLAK